MQKIKNQPHMDVRNLSKAYPVKGGFFDRTRGVVKAVDKVSFSVHRGKVFGLVGESGCGKTTIARLVLRVLEPTQGRILFSDENGEQVDLTGLKNRELRPLRQKIQMIFQDPYASLDPRMNVLQIIGEPLRAFKLASGDEYKDRVVEIAKKVKLQPDMLFRYPHAFSGGQRQRIGIARALVTNPSLVVADEPVSALDMSVQAQILNLLQDLQSEFNLTLLFISHDLAVMYHICNTLALMYRGKLVEIAEKTDFFSTPAHPYAELLFDAVPGIVRSDRQTAATVEGESNNNSAPGCHFFPRCRHRKNICASETPELRTVAANHCVACHFDVPIKGFREKNN